MPESAVGAVEARVAAHGTCEPHSARFFLLAAPGKPPEESVYFCVETPVLCIAGRASGSPSRAGSTAVAHPTDGGRCPYQQFGDLVV